MRESTAVRDACNDARETTIGTAPKLEFFDALPTTNITDADPGTKLTSMALPSDWLTSSSSGTKSKNGTWSTSAIASGYARSYRIKNNGGTTTHQDGLVSQPYAASTAVALNQQMHNGTNVYKATTAGTTGASSAPTGTGTGISDGTAVWAYVGQKDFSLNNTNLASGQTVDVSTYDLTRGNG